MSSTIHLIVLNMLQWLVGVWQLDRAKVTIWCIELVYVQKPLKLYALFSLWKVGSPSSHSSYRWLYLTFSCFYHGDSERTTPTEGKNDELTISKQIHHLWYHVPSSTTLPHLLRWKRVRWVVHLRGLHVFFQLVDSMNLRLDVGVLCWYSFSILTPH